MKKNKYPEYEELYAENQRLKEELRSCSDRLCAQKRVITNIQESLTHKNKALDSMMWVWCNGGCYTGVRRYTDGKITENIVRIAEANTKRLRTWFTNHKWKVAQDRMSKGQHERFCALTHEEKRELITELFKDLGDDEEIGS